jgi:hypothetical protein
MLAKRIALTFGIALIFPMTVHYGVRTFSPEPKWSDFAPNDGFDPAAATKEERRQHWEAQQHLNAAKQEADKTFQLHLFAVAAPLGLAAILCGAFLQAQAIGTGLIFGGIFSVCDGYFNFWSELADALRFSSLLAALAVLVFIGYKKLEKKQP